MNTASKPRVLLGVSGGIAAYKSAELVRRLVEAGLDVRVVMTRSAQAFIPALTLQAVSGHSVHRDVLDEAAEAAMGHIELARWADLVLVAPATAHVMARVAHGLADDLLTTLCLASAAPLALAPAMNQQMWRAAATQRNLMLLRDLGVQLWGPAGGVQACGDVGPGRMLEPAELVERVLAMLRHAERQAPAGVLAGRHVLITAGPTREAIDPVRYISNHSSGKMGYAVAAAAAALGASVTLVSGPTALSTPSGVERVEVVSAEQMLAAVMSRAPGSDVFVAAAAVADYTPLSPAAGKLKKSDEQMRIELRRTPDILATVAALPTGPFTVGFAAETDDLEHYARDKLRRKKLDMIAANEVGEGRGFNVDHNALTVFWEGGSAHLQEAPKRAVADALWALVVERMQACGRLAVVPVTDRGIPER